MLILSPLSASSPLPSSHSSSSNLSTPPSSNLLQLTDKGSFQILQPHTQHSAQGARNSFSFKCVCMNTHHTLSTPVYDFFPVLAHRLRLGAQSYAQCKAAHSVIASFRPVQLSFSRPAPTLCKWKMYLCPPVHS